MRKPRKVRTRTSGSSSRASTSSRKTRTTRSQAKAKTSKSKRTGFDRGASGFQKAAEKKARQDEEYERRRNTPFNLYLKPGDEAEVVILDREEPFFISMHKVKNSQGRWEDEVCIADSGQRCPLCESTGKEGSYTMYLTVLDRRPYTVKSGPNAGKTIKVSKKLLPVKGRNLPKFERQWKKYGSKANGWRGLRVACRRGGDKEASIGEDLEFLGTVPEVKLKKFGDTAEPAPYDEIFEIPSAAELVKRHNLKVGEVAGSEEFEDDTGEYDEDDVGWD